MRRFIIGSLLLLALLDGSFVASPVDAKDYKKEFGNSRTVPLEDLQGQECAFPMRAETEVKGNPVVLIPSTGAIVILKVTNRVSKGFVKLGPSAICKPEFSGSEREAIARQVGARFLEAWTIGPNGVASSIRPVDRPSSQSDGEYVY